ncbi:MAG: MCE family protein [Alphaproteobacteria bacterium]|nr:MCE family protein [Alphaproteobacteria bacterium]
METRANYIVVGVFVLAFFLGAVAFTLWVGAYQFDRKFEAYDILFTGNVTGLSKASPVTYRGIQIGEILTIRIDPNNIEQVRVTIQVPEDTPIKEDTVASIELTGLTGGRAILLSGGTRDAALLKPKAGERLALIQSRTSRLAEALEGAPTLIDRSALLLERAIDVLNDDNRTHLAATLRDVSRLAQALADQSEPIGNLVSDTAATVASLRQGSESFARAAGRIEGNMDKLLAQVDGTLGAVQKLMRGMDRQIEPLTDEIRRTAGEVRALVAENRPGIKDFSDTALYEIGATLAELRTLAAGMNRLATELERNPARFLFGNQQQGYETR